MESNLSLAQNVISWLCQHGISKFVICPGSFNSPFIAVLQKTERIELYNHFEERGAAFFSLGLSKQLQEPVVLCITSGTAVAETLPAIIEAHYEGAGLIVLSADRSEALSATGYPQAIEQTQLLSSHAEAIDIKEPSILEEFILKRESPYHLNVRFREPILAKGIEPIVNCTPTLSSKSKRLPQKPSNDNLSSILHHSKRPLVILENLPWDTRARIKSFLLRLKAPIIAEVRSGLREDQDLAALILRAHALSLKKTSFDCILRFGSVPTTDLWRTLERDPLLNAIPVHSFTRSGKFAGLSREGNCYDINLESFESINFDLDSAWATQLLTEDHLLHQQTEHLLNEFPQSEPALVNWFSKQLPTESLLYLGNSLPIREFNDFASFSHLASNVDANRGANGIDGQIASFFGAALAANRTSNWALIGDLTFLYDCNSLALQKQLGDLPFCIAVIQNQGGRIFERLPYFQDLNRNPKDKSNFTNQHALDCCAIARAFGLSSLSIETQSQTLNLPRQCMLEIRPDLNQTEKFWNAYHSA